MEPAGVQSSARPIGVSSVVGAAKHSPFSRIRTRFADITADEARARGYMKGNKKEDEVFTLLQRTTSPTTIYKKQRLDRDDILDITDFDVVSYIRGEMKIMLEEELGRAVLIGDGRQASSKDKIKEDCIRPIYKEDILYAPRVILAKETTTEDVLDSIVRAMDDYDGAGNPPGSPSPTWSPRSCCSRTRWVTVCSAASLSLPTTSVSRRSSRSR